jgi:hypothetical protein
MGKFAGVDFSWTKDEQCSRCGMIEKKSGCCRDEVKFYKFENSFKSVEYSFPATKFMDDATSASYFATGEVVHSLIQQIHVNPANLPVYTGPPIYLQNRVFRI